jgi:GNAT superfamily N-acetyltransferase
VIREARPGEAAALAAGYEWLFAPPGIRPPRWEAVRAETRLERLVAAEDATMFVADVDGDVVGICSVYLDIESVRFGRRAWIEDLAVHPEHRSAGHGKGLLDAVKDWARERGATHLELDSGEARADAHRFYERERPDYRSIQFGWELR